MRYKKCECGKVISFDEHGVIPMTCDCGRKLGSQTYSEEDMQLLNPKSTRRNETRMYFREVCEGWVLDIPDDADNYIIGRAGAQFVDHPWKNNISRKHLILTNSNECVIIHDVSTNGTRINGKKIPKDKPTKLIAGDVVTLDAIRNEISFRLQERR